MGGTSSKDKAADGSKKGIATPKAAPQSPVRPIRRINLQGNVDEQRNGLEQNIGIIKSPVRPIGRINPIGIVKEQRNGLDKNTGIIKAPIQGNETYSKIYNHPNQVKLPEPLTMRTKIQENVYEQRIGTKTINGMIKTPAEGKENNSKNFNFTKAVKLTSNSNEAFDRMKWINHQKDLLKMEEAVEKQKEEEKTCSMDSLEALTISSNSLDNYGKQNIVIKAAKPNEKLPKNKLTMGDKVTLTANSNMVFVTEEDKSKSLSGIIKFICDTAIAIIVDEFEVFDETAFIEDCLVTLTYNSSENISHKKLTDVLNAVKKVDSNSKHLISVIMQETSPKQISNRHYLHLHNENLESTQKRAVQLAMDRPDIAIIHGPPGTGKTTVLVEIIQQHIDLGEKILVCAPSNAAVDSLLLRLIKQKVEVVRLGNSVKIGDESRKYTLHNLLYNNSKYVSKLQQLQREIRDVIRKMNKSKKASSTLSMELGRLKSQLRKLEKTYGCEIIKNSDVVLSTLISASASGQLEDLDKQFNLAIIDECSQSIEVECYIPALRAPKLIIAGDHKQLPPTVISDKAAEMGLKISLMERLIGYLHSDLVVKLIVQYRMNSLIMNWSSRTLYGNELKAHDSVENHILSDLRNITLTTETVNPLILVDTAKCNFLESSGAEAGCWNNTEVNIVYQEVMKLNNAGIKSKDIAVITPYRMQVVQISNRLSKFTGLEVKTVDSFQGSEKEAVILSLVRSNKKGTVGFLKDIRRLNVAVTRARRHLTVVCDSQTVSSNKELKTFIDYLRNNALVKSCLNDPQYANLKSDLGINHRNNYNFKNTNKSRQNTKIPGDNTNTGTKNTRSRNRNKGANKEHLNNGASFKTKTNRNIQNKKSSRNNRSNRNKKLNSNDVENKLSGLMVDLNI